MINGKITYHYIQLLIKCEILYPLSCIICLVLLHNQPNIAHNIKFYHLIIGYFSKQKIIYLSVQFSKHQFGICPYICQNMIKQKYDFGSDIIIYFILKSKIKIKEEVLIIVLSV